ncbi:PilT/PilU family type 4a pilus ATPase [Candidatus Uhrbacteria bacterium]|nr:PilT/PilU family type 4a pilus ATPase [Candidatus Uhrbacteria bacterium]
MHIYDIFRTLSELNGSDIHLIAGKRPVFRIQGVLSEQEQFPVLSSEDIQVLAYALLDEQKKEALQKTKELDFACQMDDENRFRVSMFLEKGNDSLVARRIQKDIPNVDALGLAEHAGHFTQAKSGLVLITGQTGQGKSTTLAAMIDHINKNRAEHIITFEDPIEFIFPSEKSYIKQRELGQDFLSFSDALKHVVRHDPNVIMVGEIRDHETMATVMTLAETGHLVFSTLHTGNAAQTIHRIIDMFPEGQQDQIRGQLALTLRGIISQKLIRAQNGGRVAAREVLINTPAIATLIRDNKIEQIPALIQINSEIGMIPLERSLTDLHARGEISEEELHTYLDDMKKR